MCERLAAAILEAQTLLSAGKYAYLNLSENANLLIFKL